MKTRTSSLLTFLMIFAASAVAANAAGYSFFGNANYISPGNNSFRAAQVTSTTAAYPDPTSWGGIDFAVPTGLTVADLNTLSTDYKALGAACFGGSPRFTVETTGGKIDFWWTCGADGEYHNTDNLTAGNVDTGGGYGYAYQMSYAAFQAIHGSDLVTSIDLIVDGGWGSGGQQRFQFDNTLVNSDFYTYEPQTPASATACKNDGWRSLSRGNATTFKNQGDCIQYVNTGK